MKLTTTALLSGFVWGGVAFAALPYAIEKDAANDRAYIETIKADNIDNQNDLDDDAIYLASEQAANARHANQFLKANRSDGL